MVTFSISCMRSLPIFIELGSFLPLHHKCALYFITVVCKILLVSEDSNILRDYCLLLQISVLAGDFLLSRACVALASLKNTEVCIHFHDGRLGSITWYWHHTSVVEFLLHYHFFLQVVSLIAQVVEHLVTGETMQMTTTSDQRYRYAFDLLVVNI